MKKDFLKNDFNFWRKLINVWSIVFFIAIIADFLKGNAFEEILNAMATIYISALAIYVSNKEFERWYDKHEENHPGEIFVIIWSVLIFILFLLDFIFGDSYTLPGSIVSAYIAVLTILVITHKSKSLYRLKRGRQK